MSAVPASRAAGLSAGDLLRLWEVGAAQHPLDRALTILAAAEPDQARRELARLPSGRRDARLLGVYARTFGSHIAGQGRCPKCEGRVEFSLDAHELLSVSAGEVGEAPLEEASEGFAVMYRLPDSYDLAAIAQLSDVAEARQTLLQRCILQATRDGAEVDPDQAPDGVVARVVEQMATHDPLAEIELALACPTCGQRWQLFFDIASFLWLKIEMRARRLLREVHTLARAYGWREADILALSPGRRQAYLEMVS
jgi:hypothetical protein